MVDLAAVPGISQIRRRRRTRKQKQGSGTGNLADPPQRREGGEPEAEILAAVPGISQIRRRRSPQAEAGQRYRESNPGFQIENLAS